jgi:hypothetical protein
MPILGDDPDRSERGSGPQDGADIVRIGHLVEHEKYCPVRRTAEDFVKPHILQRLDLDDDALVRRVSGDKASEVGDIGQRHGEVLRELHEAGRVPRRPGLQDSPVRIIERCSDCVAAPKARALRGTALVVGALSGHGAAQCEAASIGASPA